MGGSPEPAKAGGSDTGPPLTAEQYVILAEAQRKKRALAETRLKYNELVEENRRLLEERQQTEKNTYEVTEAMRRDLFNKNEQIVELQTTLSEKEAAYDVQLRTTVADLEQRLAAQEAAGQRTEERLRGEAADLSKELAELEAFTQAKDDLERSQLAMRAENDALKAKLDKVEQEEERRYVHGTMMLKREYEQKMEELKKRYEEDMDERLDASIKRILLQSRRAAQELQLHMDESALLQKENKILTEERHKLLRELNMKVELEQGYVARNAKQARDIKEANSKLVALEKTLQSFVEDFEKERQFMREQWRTASEGMNKEVDGYRRLVDLKMKESKNIRRLAQEVLLQRSDVETFFVSSLQHVCKQLELEAQRDCQLDSGAKARVDISQLSWAQRESVLRLAFAKINNQARQAHFQRLPKHSLMELEAEQKQAAETVIACETLSGLVSDAAKPQLA